MISSKIKLLVLTLAALTPAAYAELITLNLPAFKSDAPDSKKFYSKISYLTIVLSKNNQPLQTRLQELSKRYAQDHPTFKQEMQARTQSPLKKQFQQAQEKINDEYRYFGYKIQNDQSISTSTEYIDITNKQTDPLIITAPSPDYKYLAVALTETFQDYLGEYKATYKSESHEITNFPATITIERYQAPKRKIIESDCNNGCTLTLTP